MKTNNKNWKPVTISGFTGILMGGGSVLGMQAMSSMQNGKASDGQVTEQSNVNASNHELTFREAFDAARAELGPGGVFTWHGNLYNTYTVEEWSAMSENDQESFVQQVSPEINVEDIDTSTFADEETTEEKSEIETDISVVTEYSEPAVESEDDDVHVVGYGEVALDNGQNITVHELDVNGQRVAVIDVDQDGDPDYAMSDINHNQQMDEGEVIDLHTGEALSFTNDDTSADIVPDSMDI